MRVAGVLERGRNHPVLVGFDRRAVLIAHRQQLALNEIVTNASRARIAGLRVAWPDRDDDALDLRFGLGRLLFLRSLAPVGSSLSIQLPITDTSSPTVSSEPANENGLRSGRGRAEDP